MLVVDSNNKLVGLISQKYLYKVQSPRKLMNEEQAYVPGVLVDGDSVYNKEVLDGYILRQVMFKKPFTMSPEHTLAEAVLYMSSRNVSCIPVVDADHVVMGVVTNREIVNFIARILEL